MAASGRPDRLYLLIKGFGLEEAFINSFSGFGFSIDRMSFVFYLISVLFIVVGVFIASAITSQQ